MPLKTPSFWYKDKLGVSSLWELAFWPLSFVYEAGHRLRFSSKSTFRANIPVICVGNVTAGGSGKTPVALALHDLLTARGLTQSPYFLTRGYGGSQCEAAQVDVHDGGVERWGDEALLLVEKGPVIVSPIRADGAALAMKSGADLVLMDDGFQNPSLHKDISLLVLDGSAGLGNGKLLPAGPLREHFKDALVRCDAVIIIGEDRQDIRARVPSSIPVFFAHLAPVFEGDLSARYIGFAGLGRPVKFKRAMESFGLHLVGFHAFADHYAYSTHDIDRLIAEARAKDAFLITTTKDMARLHPSLAEDIKIFPVSLHWEDEEAVASFFKARLEEARTA